MLLSLLPDKDTKAQNGKPQIQDETDRGGRVRIRL